MPSPPGFPPKSISTSGFQLLMDQMLPAQGTEISDPYVVFAIDCQTPGMVDAAAVKVADPWAVRRSRTGSRDL